MNGSHSIVAVGALKQFPHGARISYDCNNGFGTSKTAMPGIGSQVNCTDGEWSAPPLTCFARSKSGAQFMNLRLNISQLIR